MIPELHALAFTAFMSAAAWQQLRTRGASVVLVYTGVAVALSLRALVSPAAHVDGLLGLLAALVTVMALMAGRLAGGSELRLLLLVGAFLGGRDTLAGVLVTTGVMLLSVGAGAVLQRGRLRTTRAARLATAQHAGVGWSAPRLVVESPAAAGAAARAVPVSPGVAVVVGAVAGWIL